MPYIVSARREDFQDFLEKTKDLRIDTSGELNYLITMLGQVYLVQHGVSYRIFNEIIGAMECAKFETYRRQIANLEDMKKQENGDVFAPVPGATE
ncbi:MAG: hypothetical protein MUP81_01560 [Dehalococcoidia bacterium]|nr:hypothetical protein [Dehalococcoidia bacterium]